MAFDLTAKTRIEAAKILVAVVLGKLSVLDALKNFPKNSTDPSVCTCFHILVHFEADEDIRKKDPLYKETQNEFMVEVADTLSKGNPLPCNIINEYKEFYASDLIYRENTKQNIIKRLKRFINL